MNTKLETAMNSMFTESTFWSFAEMERDVFPISIGCHFLRKITPNLWMVVYFIREHNYGAAFITGTNQSFKMLPTLHRLLTRLWNGAPVMHTEKHRFELKNCLALWITADVTLGPTGLLRFTSNLLDWNSVAVAINCCCACRSLVV